MIRRTETMKNWALYLDTFKDRSDLSEGTKNDKRPFLPAAFWKRLEEVQE